MRSRKNDPMRGRGVRGLLAGALALFVLMTGLSVPALASSNNVSVKIAPVDTEVLAGENVSFAVEWQCGSTTATQCQGAQLEVVVKPSDPDGIRLPVESYTAVVINGVSYPAEVQEDGANQKIVWKFPETLAPGSTGAVSFMLKTENWVTPDGTTITPEASFSTSIGSSEQVSAPATITADDKIKVVKTKSAPSAERPYVDSEVTYKIEPGYEFQWTPGGGREPFINICNNKGRVGHVAITDMTIVDQLPEGSVFVRATAGGQYDEASHTVTWQYGDAGVQEADGKFTCNYYFGDPVYVTVIYPESVFGEAALDPTQLQTNTVDVTAKPWLRDNVLSASAQASHPLRIGAEGEFVLQKEQPYSASNERGSEFTRGAKAHWSNAAKGFLYRFSVEDKSRSVPAKWSMTDTLPCALTSPSPEKTDCATPAFVDIAFGATMSMPELHVNWTTNLGRTGVCVIPGSSDEGDTSVRLCEGLETKQPIAMGDGEWITQFSLDENEITVGTNGSLLLFGTVSDHVPEDNSQEVAAGEYQPHFYDGKAEQPAPGVTPASEHPSWVTVENCTADNTITWQGGSATTNNTKVDPDFPGRCGFLRVVRSPLELETTKRMYNPQLLPNVNKDAQPSVIPGQHLRVEVLTQRTGWDGMTQEQKQQARFTPIITDILPANLEYAPLDPENPVYLHFDSPWGDAYPEYARPESAALEKLGKPRVALSEVTIDGEIRTKVVIDFPDAPDGGGLLIEDPDFGDIADILNVGFDVRVKEGTPSGSTRNYQLTQAEEAEEEFLRCSGMADSTELDKETTWQNFDRKKYQDHGPGVDAGCRAQKAYTVQESAGVTVAKEVKGSRDSDFIVADGVGSTSKEGLADYRIPVVNSGNIDTRNIVVYDMLPRVGDHGVKPGAEPRGSEFDVFMTGPVTGLPSGVRAEYSTSANPCRGELLASFGGVFPARGSAPAQCEDSWSAAEPADWSTVTAIRVDFGSMVWKPLDQQVISFPAQAGPGGDITKIAWNNVAAAGVYNSNGKAFTATEGPRVGLELTPDLSWQKTDAADGKLLAGSEWSLTPIVGENERLPRGDWPRVIADCSETPCDGEDKSAAAGKFTLENVPWGTYELRETKAPEGYVLLEDPVVITVGPGHLNEETWTYEIGSITNAKPGADLVWQKTDVQSKRLAGSQWELIPVDDDGNPITDGSVVAITDCVQEDAEQCQGVDKDPEAGKFRLTQVATGTYHLVETVAPAGFMKLTKPIPVTISGDTVVDLGKIINDQVEVPTLPLTGGIGTYLFMIAGGLFLALTAAMVIRTQRHKRLEECV
ncbi:SpaA isopeptide-forming pilin-related protein [Leucobacter chinensis]|uniref:SpaA isopeptide-forming pilin-related protein n=1 Tax=Leucobacter chinensis TaxID=2851010 RepID=UPI001C231890|nr:SpaA isopeptide-forming pilin-related protein [Leucobacter chinensis]